MPSGVVHNFYIWSKDPSVVTKFKEKTTTNISFVKSLCVFKGVSFDNF